MADLATGSSGYATGSTDTWTAQVNNDSPHRAEHVNGLAAAILQIEQVLGSGSTLPGSLSTLAARLAVQYPADGVLFPIGALLHFAGTSAPTGWLFCDGSAVSRTTYANLFSVVGTTYGTGDGSTTFNLPDFRGRVPMGSGTGTGGGTSGTGVVTGGSALTARAVGAWGGEEAHLNTSAESGMPAHGHNLNVQNAYDNDGNGNAFRSGLVGGTPIFTASASSASAADAASAHNNVQPFLVCNVLIKT